MTAKHIKNVGEGVKTSEPLIQGYFQTLIFRTIDESCYKTRGFYNDLAKNEKKLAEGVSALRSSFVSTIFANSRRPKSKESHDRQLPYT